MDNSDTAPTVAVRALTKTWPNGTTAVDGITFDVWPGEVFGLLGPNGAGKSTTIGMLTTTVLPTSGSATLGGVDIAADPIRARALSAAVFQDRVVDRALSGRRNLELHARLWGVQAATARSRVEALSRRFGLVDILDRPVATYSGGQRRRLEIARAILSEPRILFLDEPTVGLDPRVRFELLDLIAGLRERTSMTILLTTHYLDEAERLCDRVAIMHRGRVVALDSPRALLDSLGAEVLELRVDDDAELVLARLRAAGVADERSFTMGSTITVPVVAGPARQVAASIAALDVHADSINARRPTLDDVYLRLTGDRLAA